MRLLSLRQPASESNTESGFTIVELMVASLIFSVVLIVITVGVIQFTNGYYRGINTTNTQTTAQAAIDYISQSAQFSSGGTAVGASGYFCAGGKVFVYSPGKQFLGTPSLADKGLYMMDNTAATCADPGVVSGGKELLGKNMRVIQVSVTAPTAPKYLSQVKLMIAYGDSDLLCAPTSSPGSCASGAATLGDPALTASDVVCKSQVGSQWCSIANLTAVAQQRLVLN